MENNRLDPWWVTGIVDGEGSFNARKVPEENTIALSLRISLRADDSRILEKIKDFFGTGIIYYPRQRTAKSLLKFGIRNAHPCVTYEIFSKKDFLNVIIPHFDCYPLQSKKKKDYEICREIACFPYPCRFHGLLPEYLLHLVDELKRQRQYNELQTKMWLPKRKPPPKLL